MCDIVERLRNDSSWAQPLFNEAAGEIERLRAEKKDLAEKAIKALEMWRDAAMLRENERLRAALLDCRSIDSMVANEKRREIIREIVGRALADSH